MDRKPRRGSRISDRAACSVAACSVAALTVITLVAIAACRPPVGAPASAASSSAPTPIATPTPVPTLTPSATGAAQTRPAWVSDLEGELECDGPMNQMDQEVPAEVGPFDPAPTPERSLEGLLRVGMYAWLPARGFEAPHVEGHWAVYRYSVDGAPKAVAVSTNQFIDVPGEVGWEIVGLRACDPSEFDVTHGLTDETTVWFDATGAPQRTDRIFSRPGPGHCGWEVVTFLHLGDELYLRDPAGVLGGQTALQFQQVEALPADVVDTDLHSATLRLFRVADHRAVYVRHKDGSIERWGRATEQVGCM